MGSDRDDAARVVGSGTEWLGLSVEARGRLVGIGSGRTGKAWVVGAEWSGVARLDKSGGVGMDRAGQSE